MDAINFLAWRPQGIATTIYGRTAYRAHSRMVVAIPCGRHAHLSAA